MYSLHSDTIIQEVDQLKQKVDRRVPLSQEEQDFLLTAEEVLAISLNQIDYINNILKDQEMNS